ncbi:MAG TPA: hypothetical protein PKK60_02180 [archaeon]|nr:hypothetical protein [archaeon]
MVSTTDYDHYLAKKAASLIRENFQERGVTNLLVVKWGGKWSRKLGHIKPLKNNKNCDTEFGSIIEINSLLKDIEVPEYVLDYVLMHELTHYFQGFGSNHERKAKHPHRGGIVDKEIERLGWGEIMENSEKWLKENWPKILEKNGKSIYVKPRKFRQKRIKLIKFFDWFR